MQNMTERLAHLETEVGALRANLDRLSSTVGAHLELAVTRPSTVLAGGTKDRARRAQLRASSRSPDPRAAAAAIQELDQLDSQSLAMYGGPAGGASTQHAHEHDQTSGNNRSEIPRCRLQLPLAAVTEGVDALRGSHSRLARSFRRR